MRREYRGYTIVRCEETARGIGTRVFYEIWKDGQDWGFTSKEMDAEIMIDRRIERQR